MVYRSTPLSYSGYDDGIEIDDKSKAYIIHVPANASSIDKDKYIDNSFNSIIGVDSKGNTDIVIVNSHLERIDYIMTTDKIKRMLDACYLAKRIRELKRHCLQV